MEEEEAEEAQGHGGMGATGVAAKGGLVGVTYHRVCLCVSTSPDLRERSSCAYVCMRYVGARALSPVAGRRADGAGRGKAGARGQIRGMVV